MSRIAIVSNRLPPPNSQTASAGGLAVGLSAALEETGGTWLGWDGTTTSKPGNRLHTRQVAPYKVVSFALTERERAAYYVGFANRTLWPLHHGRTDLLKFDWSEFESYRSVNRKFAEHLAGIVRGHDLIWVHDYHLFLLGEELRKLGITLPIGFFLHIPFPAPDTVAALPCYREITEGLSAYDLVGFQTANDLQNFKELVRRHFGWIDSGGSTILGSGRTFRVGAFPIGIDARHFEGIVASNEFRAHCATLRQRFGDRSAIIGVDRLDYSKGLPQRLLAFEHFIKTSPEYKKRVFLLQIAAPSRDDIPEYIDLRAELEALSGRINARHSEIDWTPVRYLNRAFNQACLTAFYRVSRIGLVTPFRDGMNLVAMEYVAAQDPDDPGVLVLSRFAGAAERLDGALIVDPYDIGGMASRLREALEMPRNERVSRWSNLIAEVRAHNIHDWRDHFLRTLGCAEAPGWLDPRLIQPARLPLAGWPAGRGNALRPSNPDQRSPQVEPSVQRLGAGIDERQFAETT